MKPSSLARITSFLVASSLAGCGGSGSAVVGAPEDGGGSGSSSGAGGSGSGSGGGSSSGSASSSGSGSGGGSGSSSGSGSGSGSSSGGGSGSSSGSSSGGGSGSSSGSSSGGDSGGAHAIKTVFIIVMENENWSSITGDASATYINGTLLTQGAYATNYYDNPKAVHPSEPNYIWMEAGDNLGFTTDDDPSASHLQPAGTDHLVKQLTSAGVSWHTYDENLSPEVCGITSSGLYAPKHDPVVFFQDVVGGPTPSDTSSGCTGHVFDYSKFAGDLQSGAVAQYNFITPNLCDDMHNTLGCTQLDPIVNGDKWLSTEVPKILASNAYKDNGALFIVWDESEGGEFPIGMIVLSPLAKPGGYTSTIKYYHSSLLRSVETIFGVPFLRDAANQADLSDLFTTFP